MSFRSQPGGSPQWESEAKKHSPEGPEFDFLQEVAKQVAGASTNALAFERVGRTEQVVTRRFERERLRLEINNAVVSHLSLRDLLKAISLSLRQVIPHDAALNLGSINFACTPWICTCSSCDVNPMGRGLFLNQ